MKFDKSRKEHQHLVLRSSGEYDSGILDVSSLNSAFLCWEMGIYLYSGSILKVQLVSVILISFSMNQVLFLRSLTRS